MRWDRSWLDGTLAAPQWHGVHAGLFDSRLTMFLFIGAKCGWSLQQMLMLQMH
jgi:hypothetical protein